MRFVRTLVMGGLVLGLGGGALLVAPGGDGPSSSVAGSEIPTDGNDRRRAAPTVVTPSTVAPTTSTTPTTVAVTSTDHDDPAGAPVTAARGTGPDMSIDGTEQALAIPAADPSAPIGDVAVSGHAPADIGFAAFPGSSGAPSPRRHDGPSGYGVAAGCHTSCITSGLAYPRGFGAELVIETDVPATVFVSVIADTTGDGDYDFGEFTTSDALTSEFRWVLDHLDPAQGYFVTIAATDAHDRTDHAFGSFTTLSTRTVAVSLDGIDFAAPPADVEVIRLWSRIAGGLDLLYANAMQPVVTQEVGERFVDHTFTAEMIWGGDDCISTPIELLPLQGYSEYRCSRWASATDTVDLDTLPNFATRWTTSEFPVRLESPDGTPMPFFRFRVDLVVHVSYS